jgi:uncharacterized OB-fold protein
MLEQLAHLHPDRWTEPFWAAAREHRLVAARCVSCGTLRQTPPGPFCWECSAQEVQWIDLPGTGVVHSYTVVRSAGPAAAQDVPFVMAVVDLDDAPGVRLITNIVDIDVDEVTIGRQVVVRWDDVDDETTIPRFAPVQ